MEPADDHQREIAEIIDRKCKEPDCSYESALAEVAASVSFAMTRADILYLVELLRQKCPPRARKTGQPQDPASTPEP